jgi:hypothetical protein
LRIRRIVEAPGDGRQALLVVVHLRKGETYADLAIGFDVGTTMVYRYLREALDLLAAVQPRAEAHKGRCGRAPARARVCQRSVVKTSS